MTKKKKPLEDSSKSEECLEKKNIESSSRNTSIKSNTELIVSHSPTFESISLDGLSFVNEHCSSSSCRCRKSQKRSTKAIDNLSECNAFGPSSPKIFKLKSNTNLSSELSCDSISKKLTKYKGMINKIIKSHSTENTTENIKQQPVKTSDLKLLSFNSKILLQDFKNLVNITSSTKEPDDVAISFSGANFNTLRCHDVVKHVVKNGESEKPGDVDKSNVIKDIKADDTNKASKVFDDKIDSSKYPNNSQQQPILSSCSQEAFAANTVTANSITVNNNVAVDDEDWSMDELSCYFEDFCHIPKKMSEMAKMMYA